MVPGMVEKQHEPPESQGKGETKKVRGGKGVRPQDPGGRGLRPVPAGGKTFLRSRAKKSPLQLKLFPPQVDSLGVFPDPPFSGFPPEGPPVAGEDACSLSPPFGPRRRCRSLVGLLFFGVLFRFLLVVGMVCFCGITFLAPFFFFFPPLSNLNFKKNPNFLIA